MAALYYMYIKRCKIEEITWKMLCDWNYVCMEVIGSDACLYMHFDNHISLWAKRNCISKIGDHPSAQRIWPPAAVDLHLWLLYWQIRMLLGLFICAFLSTFKWNIIVQFVKLHIFYKLCYKPWGLGSQQNGCCEGKQTCFCGKGG
jgi:hypothetical protein